LRSLHFLSLTTVPIQVLNAQGTVISDATGFFYESAESKLFLITNWHVVTGRNPSNSSESKTGTVPCTLRAKLHRRQTEKKDVQESVRLGSVRQMDFTVNSENGNNPEWFEHPQYKRQVDVVGIEIKNREELEEKYVFKIINKWESLDSNYVAEVMDDIFVVGYPWGISGSGGAVPLYKRGCIASDPVINSDGAPKLLIDCRTTEGMSGAPVIVSHRGIWNPDGKFSGNSVIGTVNNFLGIYSGRLYDQNIQDSPEREISEIGIVWEKELLGPITSNGVPGTGLNDIIT